MGYPLTQNSSSFPLVFFLEDSATPAAGKTGLSPTVKLGKNGGSGASPSGSVSEIDSTNLPGWYKVAGNSTDSNTLGPLTLHASASGALDWNDQFAVCGYNPQTATNLGLSALPTANPAANGGLPTVDASNNVHGLQTRTCSDASVIGTGTGTSTLTQSQVSGYAGPILTDNSTGAVTVGSLATAAIASIWNALTSGMTTAGSIGARLIAYLTGDIFGRLGAPAGASVSADIAAVQTAVNNVNNLSALAVIYGPGMMEIPASSSIAYRLTLLIKDAEGHMLDLSGSPTLTAINAAGTDRSANLSAVTHTSTGVYDFTYSVSSAAAQEGLRIAATGTASSDSTSRVAVFNTAAVAVDTTAALAAIKTKTDLIATNSADSPNAVTAQGTIATNLDAGVSTRSTVTQSQVFGDVLAALLNAIGPATPPGPWSYAGTFGGQPYWTSASWSTLYYLFWNAGASQWCIQTALSNTPNTNAWFGPSTGEIWGVYTPRGSFTALRMVAGDTASNASGAELATAAAMAALGAPQQAGTKYAVSLAAADVTGNLPANAVQIGGTGQTGADVGQAAINFGKTGALVGSDWVDSVANLQNAPAGGGGGGGGATAAQIWAYARRTLTGAGGAVGPTAGANLASVGFGPVPPLETIDLSAAVSYGGQYATIEGTASISYTIYRVLGQQGVPVTGHSGVALTPSAVLFDTLQTDAEAANYNFRFRPDQSLGEPFPEPGGYIVVVAFTTTGGQVYYANFRGRAGW